MSKRLKRVFTTSREVAHIWASRSQADGRCRNTYFHGDTIFSYGGHYTLGLLVDVVRAGKKEVVALINTRRTSVTTSGHQREARVAVGHLTTFNVPVVSNLRDDQTSNIIRWIENFQAFHQEAITARNYSDTPLKQMRKASSELMRYIEVFNIKAIEKRIRESGTHSDKSTLCQTFRLMKAGVIPDRKLIEEKIAIQRPRNEARRKKANAKRAAQWEVWRKQATQREIEQAEQKRIEEEKWSVIRANIGTQGIEAWRNNFEMINVTGHEVDVDRYMNNHYKGEVLLRITKDQIETSMGAFVPIDRCKKLWSYMKDAMELGKRMDKFNESNRVGSYEFNSFDGKTLVISCHNIGIEEVLRFTKQEGW